MNKYIRTLDGKYINVNNIGGFEFNHKEGDKSKYIVDIYTIGWVGLNITNAPKHIFRLDIEGESGKFEEFRKTVLELLN